MTASSEIGPGWGELRAGEVLDGTYRIESKIGQGSMGSVECVAALAQAEPPLDDAGPAVTSPLDGAVAAVGSASKRRRVGRWAPALDSAAFYAWGWRAAPVPPHYSLFLEEALREADPTPALLVELLPALVRHGVLDPKGRLLQKRLAGRFAGAAADVLERDAGRHYDERKALAQLLYAYAGHSPELGE